MRKRSMKMTPLILHNFVCLVRLYATTFMNAQNDRVWCRRSLSKPDAIDEDESLTKPCRQQNPGFMIGTQFSFGHGLGAVREVPLGAKVYSEPYITLLCERYPSELRAWYADDADIHWQQSVQSSFEEDQELPPIGERSSWYLGPAANPDLSMSLIGVCWARSSATLCGPSLVRARKSAS